MVENEKKGKNAGFSLLELMISVTVILVLLGITTTLFSSALGTRSRESRRTDALTSAQAALNIISRELSNSGYGLTNNGLITEDSNQKRIHFRSNVVNTDSTTNSSGEDVTYFYDSNSQSIVRYDPNDSPKTSVIINRISDLNLIYFDYSDSSSTPTQRSTPTSATGRVTISVTVRLENVPKQPANQTITFTSDVTLRNSDYMLFQY